MILVLIAVSHCLLRAEAGEVFSVTKLVANAKEIWCLEDSSGIRTIKRRARNLSTGEVIKGALDIWSTEAGMLWTNAPNTISTSDKRPVVFCRAAGGDKVVLAGKVAPLSISGDGNTIISRAGTQLVFHKSGREIRRFKVGLFSSAELNRTGRFAVVYSAQDTSVLDARSGRIKKLGYAYVEDAGRPVWNKERLLLHVSIGKRNPVRTIAIFDAATNQTNVLNKPASMAAWGASSALVLEPTGRLSSWDGTNYLSPASSTRLSLKKTRQRVVLVGGMQSSRFRQFATAGVFYALLDGDGQLYSGVLKGAKS